METTVSGSVILSGMGSKKIKTVPIHARIPESDVAAVDKAADDELISRSMMVARIVREWVKRKQSHKLR